MWYAERSDMSDEIDTSNIDFDHIVVINLQINNLQINKNNVTFNILDCVLFRAKTLYGVWLLKRKDLFFSYSDSHVLDYIDRNNITHYKNSHYGEELLPIKECPYL